MSAPDAPAAPYLSHDLRATDDPPVEPSTPATVRGRSRLGLVSFITAIAMVLISVILSAIVPFIVATEGSLGTVALVLNLSALVVLVLGLFALITGIIALVRHGRSSALAVAGTAIAGTVLFTQVAGFGLSAIASAGL